MIETDAPNVGWGVTYAGIETQGQWKESERPLHINEKELLAASLAIKAFTKDKKVDHIILKTDNTTTVNQIMKIKQPIQSNSRSVEILSGQPDNVDSRTLTRSDEHNGGQRVQSIQRLQQLETKWESVSNDNESVRQSRIRPVCRQNESSTTKIYQLETRSNSSDDGRILSEMEQHSRVWIPTNLPNRQMSGQSERRASVLDHNHAYVARPTLVCDSVTDDNRESHTVAPNELSTHWTDKRVSSYGSSWCNDSSRLENIRQNALNPGLLSEDRNLLQRKLSGGSKKTYQGPWKRWCCWCNQISLDPISAPVESVASYLAEEQRRVCYSALNTTRSAISAYHDKCDGKPVGQHELIKDIMESALKIKPPKPKHTSTWDVNLVLEYIRQLCPNASLDRKTLTLKVTMLMSLVSVARGHVSTQR